MPSSPERLVPQDTLLEPNRQIRRPLRAWAGDIVLSLREQEARDEPSPIALSIAWNLAALIAAHRGDLAGAEDICLRSLAWSARGRGPEDEARRVVLAIQPWINIGRLRRLAGRADEALAHFDLLAPFDAGRAVTLGPAVLDAATWQRADAADPSLRHVLRTVLVNDSLRALLSARRHDDALSFASAVRPRCEPAQIPYLEEAGAVACAHLGRTEAALAAAAGPGWESAGMHGQMVSAACRIGVLMLRGEITEAARLAHALCATALVLRVADGDDPRVLRLFHHLGGLAVQLDLRGPAAAIFSAGLAGARRLEDEPLEIAFLDALADVGSAEVADRCRREREAALSRCLYAAVLRREGRTAEEAASRDPVFAELEDIVARLTSG